MKKIILVLIAVLSVSGAFAQQYRVETATYYDSVVVYSKQRYYAPFLHNMYIQGALAGRVLDAEDDNALPFGQRVKPGFMFAVGSNITPVFGVRLSVGGSRLDGWNSGERGIYKVDGTWTVNNVDGVKDYWESLGVSTANGYKQQIKYYEINADFTVDVINVFNRAYNFKRKFDADVYAGMGVVNIKKWHGTANNSKASLRLGAILSYKISPRLSANVEMLYAMSDATLDGEIGKGRKYDKYYAGMAGLSLRIGKQGYKLERRVSAEQYAAISSMSQKIRREIKDSEDKIIVNEIVIREPETDLLSPTIVFDMGDMSFNEELQMVNVYQVSEYMKQNPDLRIAVVGNLATTERMLARRRAEKIKSILVERYSIPENRLEILVEDFKKVFDSAARQNQSVLFRIALENTK